MSEEKAPGSGAFFPASLMYFCSGKPMHLCSGVDNLADDPLRAANDRIGEELAKALDR